MAEATIDSLKLEISSSSDGASKGLDALTKSLKKLQSATSKGLGLTAVVNELKSADTSIKSSSLDGLTKAVDTLSKLGSVKISASIGNQITAISTALQGANFQDGADKMQSLVTALEPLGQLGKSNLSSYVTQLKKLPDVITELNKLDMGAVSAKFQELATALKPLGDEMQKVANGFSAFPAKIQKLITSTNKLTLSNNKASTSYINLYAKLKMAWTAVKGVARKISEWITLSSDYTETMNLFTVSMGQYAEEAYNYAQIVGDAMGIDPAEWMKKQGVFMTLTKGFGVAGDRANKMSQQLTQLGYDLSSFFNISVEDVMTKLESGIAGELEPLRRLGYDLSQAKLEATALSLGIDKAVSSMTQAEKAELRYYAIMTQVTDAHGDMARTLNAPANQMRILNAQVTQLGRALGNFFIPLLNKVLPYVIASVKVLREVLDVFMGLLGIELADVDFGSDSITSATDEVVSNLEDAQDEAKKLKSYMLGFDELNVLNTDDGSSLEDLLGTGFDFELPTYDFMEGIVATQIDEIVGKMKDWLGLTGEIEDWTDLMNTRFGKILKKVTKIGAGILAWKLTKGFLDGLTMLKTILSNPSYVIAISAVVTVAGIVFAFDEMEDAIANGLNEINFGGIVGNSLLAGTGAAILGSKLATWITTAFAGSKVATALTTAAINLFGQTAGPITAGAVTATGGILAAAVTGIILGIPSYLVGIYDACKNGIDWLSGLLIPAGSTAAAAGIGAIIGACGGPIGAGVGALIGLVVGLVTDGVILIVQNWDKIGAAITKWWDDLCVWASNIPGSVKKWFDDFWEPIRNYDWYGLGYDVGQWFGNVWKDVVRFVTESIPNWFSNMWESVKSAFRTFFTVTLPTFFLTTIPNLWQTIKTEFVTFFSTTLPNALSSVGNWFKDVGKSIWNGIVQGWNTVVDVIGDFVGGFVQGFKDALGIHSPSTVFAEIGKFLIQGLLNGMKSVYTGVITWFNTTLITPISDAFSNTWSSLRNGASSAWEGVKSVFSSVATFFKDTFRNAWNGVVSVFSYAGNIFVNIRDGVLNAFKVVVNGLINGINSVIASPFNAINNALTTIRNISIAGMRPFSGLGTIPVPRIPTLADGGMVSAGGLFIAREAGPELVGSIGNRTTVMNNDQIVESVSAGVYQAVLAALGGGNEDEGNTNIVINLDGEKIYENQQKIARGRGYNLGMGAFSFG